MGITSSKNEINKIASDYIIHLNTSDMKQLIDKDGYKNIMKLVNTIVCKKVSRENIELLYNDLFSVDNDVNVYKNKCIKISQFYVNIAHLFSSIVMTLNPSKRFFKQDQDTDTEPEKTNVMSLCSNRLHSLIDTSMKKNSIYNKEEGYFPELESLYYDKYDFKTDKFNNMTFTMRKKYEKDVNMLYKSFTGRNIPVKNRKRLYKKFSDIQLTDILNIDENNGIKNDGIKNNGIKNDGIKNDELSRLFKAYSDNIKIMITYVYIQEKELIKIINKLFKRVNNHYYVIYNNLNMNDLDKLISETQTIIMKMNSKCDDFYVKGVQIYDAIVQLLIKNTTIKQIKNGEKMMEKLYSNEYIEGGEGDDTEGDDTEGDDTEGDDTEGDDTEEDGENH